MAGLESAVSSGRISVARIDESVRRILAAKARIGLDKQRLVDVPRLNEKFGLPAFDQDAQRIADRGVTLLRDTPKLLPLDSTRPLRVLLVALSADPDPFPAETLEPEIRPRVDSLTVLRADTQFTSVTTLKLPNPDTYDVAIAALFVRVADRKGNVGFPDDQRAFIDQLLAAGKPTVVAGFGSPYLIERFPNAPTWLAEFATNDVSQRAAGRALVWPDRHRRTNSGHRSRHRENRRWNASRGKSDGASARSRRDVRISSSPHTTCWTEPSPTAHSPAECSPWVGTTNSPCIPLANCRSDPKSPAVTRRHNLRCRFAHQAHRHHHGHHEPRRSAANSTWTRPSCASCRSGPKPRSPTPIPPGARESPSACCCSTIRDFRRTGTSSKMPKDATPFWRRCWPSRSSANPARKSNTPISASSSWVKLSSASPAIRWTKPPEDIFAPLRMNDSLFNPPKNLRSRIAPTEDDASYRKRLLQGEVDDENAWAMGGVAGHAGLFSTAGDIAAFAQMLLNGGIYAHSPHAPARDRSSNSPLATRSAIPRALSAGTFPCRPPPPANISRAKSFGHLGFTGTSLWIDPERNLFVVLLTNRVNPTRANEKIRQVRPALHDAVFQALGLATEPVAAR